MENFLTPQFLANILQASPGLIYIYNIEDYIGEYTSPISVKLAGYSQQDLYQMKGKMIQQLVHPEDIPKVKAHFDSFRKNPDNETKILEYRLIPKGSSKDSDRPAWIVSYDRPLERNNKNEVTKVCGIGIEVTELKNAQLNLVSQFSQLENITKMSPLHTVITDAATGTIIYSSNTLSKSLGYDMIIAPNTVRVYDVFKDVMVPEDFKTYSELLKSITSYNVQESYQVEFRLYDKQGSVRWFTWTGVPYEWSKSSQITSIVHFVQEITNLKQNQLRLEAINSELEEYTYVSSHDLIQPLNTIKASLVILKNELKEIENVNVRKCLSMMSETTDLMKENIQTILEYSKVKSEMEFNVIDLNNLMHTALKSLDSIISSSKVSLDIDNLPHVNGDANLIQMVFQNLVSNAIKFQKRGNQPKVKIEFEQTTLHQVIHFHDNGIGIAQEQQERIFTLFQRLHKKEQFEGNGIGLAHSRKIMRLHSGKLLVKSMVDKGSTFSCFFLRGI